MLASLALYSCGVSSNEAVTEHGIVEVPSNENLLLDAGLDGAELGSWEPEVERGVTVAVSSSVKLRGRGSLHLTAHNARVSRWSPCASRLKSSPVAIAVLGTGCASGSKVG